MASIRASHYVILSEAKNLAPVFVTPRLAATDTSDQPPEPSD